jgi:hypothetical protein
MNTFLPHVSFADSVGCLDQKRLKNQVNECTAILAALGGAKAWNMHPATLMWRRYQPALRAYKNACLMECKAKKVAIDVPYERVGFFELPHWVGWQTIHDEHKGSLYGKNPEHYAQFAGHSFSGYSYPTPDVLSYLEPARKVSRVKRQATKEKHARSALEAFKALTWPGCPVWSQEHGFDRLRAHGSTTYVHSVNWLTHALTDSGNAIPLTSVLVLGTQQHLDRGLITFRAR